MIISFAIFSAFVVSVNFVTFRKTIKKNEAKHALCLPGYNHGN